MLSPEQSQFIEKLRAEHPEVTPELITTTLRGEGWSEEDIAEVVRGFEGKSYLSTSQKEYIDSVKLTHPSVTEEVLQEQFKVSGWAKEEISEGLVRFGFPVRQPASMKVKLGRNGLVGAGIIVAIFLASTLVSYFYQDAVWLWFVAVALGGSAILYLIIGGVIALIRKKPYASRMFLTSLVYVAIIGVVGFGTCVLNLQNVQY